MSIWRTFWRRDEAKSLTIIRDGHYPEPDGFYPLKLREHGAVDTGRIQHAMTTNEMVFACLKILAQAASDPRLIVQRKIARRDGSGKTEYEEVPNHPLRRLIARPNKHMTEGDLMRACVISWNTTRPRRFFAEKEFQRGLLVGLWPLNPSRMAPRYSEDATRRLIGYRWSDGTGRYVDYTLDELIIREAPEWYDPAPGAAALGSILSDQAQTDYIWSFFENGGMPSIFVKDKERQLRQEQRDEFRARWRATYGNRRGGQHDVGVLDSSQEVQKVGSGLDELDSETLRDVMESRICMVFGVPSLIIYANSGLKRATYSNLKEAWSSFWDYTMSPALKEWREFWTLALLPEFEDELAITSGKVRLWWDMSGVSALQDDVDALETRAANSYTKGIRMKNEARAMLGLAPVDGGDTFYVKPAPTVKPNDEDKEEDDDGR
jgi:HK97 family phage portal protein